MAWKVGTLGMDDEFWRRNYGKKEKPRRQETGGNKMVWKSCGGGYGLGEYTGSYNPSPKPRQQGAVIAQVGDMRRDVRNKGETVSRKREDEWIENVYGIDNTLLGHNIGRRILLRCPDNDAAFDHYVGLPFSKGMTERGTGRTMLILGSNAHHGEVMTGQFENVLWTPEDKESISYGDLIRWINVGDVKDGFVGLDYNPEAGDEWGVAKSREDISFLAERLIEYGYDEKKRLFLLKPPHIIESTEGHAFRKEGYQTLADYVKLA